MTAPRLPALVAFLVLGAAVVALLALRLEALTGPRREAALRLVAALEELL